MIQAHTSSMSNQTQMHPIICTAFNVPGVWLTPRSTLRYNNQCATTKTDTPSTIYRNCKILIKNRGKMSGYWKYVTNSQICVSKLMNTHFIWLANSIRCIGTIITPWPISMAAKVVKNRGIGPWECISLSKPGGITSMRKTTVGIWRRKTEITLCPQYH